MASDPRALEPGWRFADRFEAKEVLGRGGFGIAYLATDLLRGDMVVVKELAPKGTPRSSSGVLQFEDAEGHRLREQFLGEAALLSRFDIKGVPPIRATFRENGTAYFATDHVPDSQTLEALLEDVGLLSADMALEIFVGLLDILEVVHAKRILHRDIKPSNVLISKKGEVYLIDFGAAREWHADATTTHTVLYTPGYAPPEQMSHRAHRGPATDLYAVCATFFVMILGVPPPSAADRASGVRLPSLQSIRQDLDPIVIRTVERGLSLAYSDRPQTVTELRDLLAGELDPVADDSLTAIDETLVRLNRFSFERRSCPSCKGLLDEPRPLRRYVCPVCQSGSIKRRDIQDRLCPVCQLGVLAMLKNANPLAICPTCRHGILSYRRKSLVSLEQVATCDSCDARFDSKAGKLASMDEASEFYAFDYWRNLSGRSAEIWKCADCSGQFDVLPDGRWAQQNPKPKGSHRVLYPDEWARVAIGLDPGAGNAQCDTCQADFYIEKERLTLLDAAEDTFGFAEAYTGRLLTIEDARWLGAGKTSPNPGFLCSECHTEFDKDHQYMRLVATRNRKLARFIDQPKVLEDWHRIAQGLPTIHAEEELDELLTASLRNAYRNGDVSFDSENTVLWKGPAAPVGEDKTSTLLITHDVIVFGGLLWKKRQPTDAVVGVWADDEELHFQFSGEKDRIGYTVTPMELVAHLSSGDKKITVCARDLAVRLTHELAL